LAELKKEDDMQTEQTNAQAIGDAQIIRGGSLLEIAMLHGHFDVECIGPDGKLKWKDTIENTVMTEARTWHWIRSWLDLAIRLQVRIWDSFHP